MSLADPAFNPAEPVLSLTDVADEAARAFILDSLRAYNTAASPGHRAIRQPGAIRPLDVFLRDADESPISLVSPEGSPSAAAAGRIVGGLIGSTQWDWLNVDYFWLAESVRLRGYGSRLLRLAEDEAIRRGCRHSRLETFSFQARGFYEKNGYRVVGQLDGFPPGGVLYWLRKDFDL